MCVRKISKRHVRSLSNYRETEKIICTMKPKCKHEMLRALPSKKPTKPNNNQLEKHFDEISPSNARRVEASNEFSELGVSCFLHLYCFENDRGFALFQCIANMLRDVLTKIRRKGEIKNNEKAKSFLLLQLKLVYYDNYPI